MSKTDNNEEKKITNEECVTEQTNDTATQEQVEEQNEKELTPEEQLQKELSEANDKIADLNDKFLRQAAEFDNYRKRTMKEKAELIKNGGERVMEAILPVLDDFERALANMAKDDNAKEILTGIELIHTKFVNILKSNGLQKIETEGQDFNTDYHEAIAHRPQWGNRKRPLPQ